MSEEVVLKTEEELVLKRELPLRPSSPDSICPICLDQVSDSAFVESCLHKFCLRCLVEWSRVKPECPLCKVRFTIILHNVRAINDYDEMQVSWNPSPQSLIPPSFYVSVAVQRQHYFSRSVDSGLRYLRDFIEREIPESWDGASGSGVASEPAVLPTASLPTYDERPPSPLSLLTSGLTVAADWRRRRQVSAVEFRRQIYRQNQWVQHFSTPQLRERIATPSFYRANPAQLHRLVPWLNRELSVLLDSRRDSASVCSRILTSLTSMHIRSSRFYRLVRQYIGTRTAHFLHELYHFALSPHDMMMYDLHAEYARVDTTIDSVSEPEEGSRRSTRWGSPLPSFPSTQDDVIVSSVGPGGESSPIVIVISDSEDARDETNNDGHDSDGSVVIIGSLPPPALRSPVEVIDLLGDSEEEIPQSPSSIVEVPDSSSPIAVSSPTPPSSPPPVKDMTLRSTLRPFYKENSSSSESEHVRRSRKSSEGRKPIKKRKVERCLSSSSDEESLRTSPVVSFNPNTWKDVDVSLRSTLRPCYKEHSSSSESGHARRSRKSSESRKPIKKRKVERHMSTSSSDEDSPPSPPPPKKRKSKNKESKSKPTSWLKSVIAKVNNDSAGCSSWVYDLPNNNSEYHSLRPKRSRALIWDESSSD